MQHRDGQLFLSASDLANHLGCRHLTQLDLLAAHGRFRPPVWIDPKLETLQRRGLEHEEKYVRHLEETFGKQSHRVEDSLEGLAAVERTVELMRRGQDVIVQASLVDAPWRGRADILLKRNAPSDLGGWSYEIIDTKLARQTKAETILQLCLYAELVEAIQGRLPDRIGVVTPLSLEPEWYRTRDYMAYFRYVKRSLIDAIDSREETAAEPVDRCEVCRWWSHCRQHWRDIDHLSLVAGISRRQRRELEDKGIVTLAAFAEADLDFPRKSQESFARAQNQARLQLTSRRQGTIVHERKEPVEQNVGLGRLPKPSAGDLFLDFEGDHFVGERGLEYLTGVAFLQEDGSVGYAHRWAFDAHGEKEAFVWLVNLIEERRRRYPDLHVYHYHHYEPTAIKRLMGAFALHEDTVDDWLRQHVFVDLRTVVRESVQVGVEGYSLKDLEPWFGFEREVPLDDARPARILLEVAIEAGLLDEIDQKTHDTVLGYNRDDCVSLIALRDWLEGLRGDGDPRPHYKEEERKPLTERQARIAEMTERLVAGISDNEEERTPEEHARWLLAHSLGYYRREEKAYWWEFFRHKEMAYEDYEGEPLALAGLTFDGEEREGRKVYHRYTFPLQECQIRKGKVYDNEPAREGERKSPIGELVSIDLATGILVYEPNEEAQEKRPEGVYILEQLYRTDALEKSLLSIAEWVAEHGLGGDGPFRAGRDLLMREEPRLSTGASLSDEDADMIERAKVVCLGLDESILPIQGPPGTGKTYLAARVILHLVKNGKKVGVTANSHNVVKHLLRGVAEAAEECGTSVTIGHKGNEDEDEFTPDTGIDYYDKPDKARKAIKDYQVFGGMKFFWAHHDLANSVDVLVVDEASQLALADVLAVSPAAKSLVLIGDPQQLERPQKGSHPPGVDVSALDHLLGDAATISTDRGFFLPTTRRLHPRIAEFTSELFYDGRLGSLAGCERQALSDAGAFDGAGLWFVPVEHVGNRSSSAEEVEAVRRIVDHLLARSTWTDAEGNTRRLVGDDILVVAPYNMQVQDLRSRLPNIRVGTVDKFQGQEAPVVIYSMTTSSPEEAPRGLEFLYSLNRLNVATSRAKTTVILVANPALFEVDCKSPRQLRLVNAMCRFLEVATRFEI
jgi:uncharacterized protein